MVMPYRYWLTPATLPHSHLRLKPSIARAANRFHVLHNIVSQLKNAKRPRTISFPMGGAADGVETLLEIRLRGWERG